MTNRKKSRIHVALSGVPWVSNNMKEAVECVDNKAFEWSDLPELTSRNIKFGVIGKALRLIEFAFRIRKADILVQVYVDRLAAWKIKIATILGKRTILYWIGTDLYSALKGIDTDTVLQAAERADINLGCGPVAMDELKKLNVKAVSYIVPPKLSTSLAKMPEEHAVLLSVPDGREDFYGYAELRQLIDDYPAIRFHVVRNSNRKLWEADNVVFWGVLDNEQMKAVYDCVSIVIRYPEHDSTSTLLMESAIKGKRVISRNPFPDAWLATSYAELCDSLDRALDESIEPHMDIRENALELYDRRRGGEELIRIIRNVALR